MSFRFPALWAVLWLCAAGWAQTGTEPAPQAAVEPGLYATIHTSMGDIKVRLFEEEAPLTVKNFVALARGEKEYKDPRTGEMSKKPLYDGLTFHRVIPGFMIQGGDPLGDGTGGTEPIPDEFVEDLQFDVPGRLAMANSGPDSGSCQFFVTEVPTPHLNGRHTIFGQVVEGQELVAEIARVWRDEEDKPLADVHIHTIRIERVEAPKQASAAN